MNYTKNYKTNVIKYIYLYPDLRQNSLLLKGLRIITLNKNIIGVKFSLFPLKLLCIDYITYNLHCN